MIDFVTGTKGDKASHIVVRNVLCTIIAISFKVFFNFLALAVLNIDVTIAQESDFSYHLKPLFVQISRSPAWISLVAIYIKQTTSARLEPIMPA